MKKILSIILFTAVLFCLTVGCSNKEKESSSPIRIAGMKGPTSIGLVKIMDDNDGEYEFSIHGSADEITPKLIQGELDMAAVPANLASVLYNKTEGQIRVLAVNTLGVVYIVSKGTEINSLDDLKGKTVYATGKGSTPEYGLRYILSENGIDADKDISIEWKTEPTEIVAILQNSDSGIAMLPQPYVTVAQNSVEGLDIAINLNEEWKKADGNTLFITGVLVARKDFTENNKNKVNDFLNKYRDSIKYVNEDVSGAALLVEKYGIFAASVAKKAIPYCNIDFISGAEMKVSLSGYLNTLFNYNKASVGGVLPADDFYYES